MKNKSFIVKRVLNIIRQELYIDISVEIFLVGIIFDAHSQVILNSFRFGPEVLYQWASAFILSFYFY